MFASPAIRLYRPESFRRCGYDAAVMIRGAFTLVIHRWWLWRNLLQIAAGIVVVAAAIWLIGYGSDRRAEQSVHEGWTLLRAPGNLQVVAIYRNEVWAGGVNGLFCFDRKTAAPVELPVGTPRFGMVHDLLADGSGRLWVAHEQGLALYDGSRWSSLAGKPGVSPGPVMAVMKDREGALWLGRPEGVARLAGDGGVQAFSSREGLAIGPVDVLRQDRNGLIWAGSSDPKRGGLASFDGTGWRSYGLDDGLSHRSVTCMLETKDGDFWVGSGFANAGGANRMTATGRFAALTKADGLAGEKVRCIYEDDKGRLWFCSEYDGVALFSGGKPWRILTTADGLAGQEVKKVIQDADGVYWLATDRGLNRIKDL